VTGTKRIPLDLWHVAVLVILTDIFVLVPLLKDNLISKILGLSIVFFLPGYASIAAFFPAKNDLDGIERVALSFGLSIAIVPLIGLGLNYATWGIRLFPILISLSIFTIVMCGLAYLRRAKLPENDAFEVPFRKIALSLKEGILEKPKLKLDKILTIFLIFSILLSVPTLIHMTLTPKEGEHFTEFYILGPEGKADNYPTSYVLGESGTLILGVVNHEYKPVNYTIEVRLENKFLQENLQTITLAHNETWKKSIVFTPPFEGEIMKLEFLLFNETNRKRPYRDLHLWIDVTENARKT
jgi:uncharacterized membrane protein